jgi:hypothetical protein
MKSIADWEQYSKVVTQFLAHIIDIEHDSTRTSREKLNQLNVRVLLLNIRQDKSHFV